MTPYTLTETPGGFYALAYWMSACLFIFLNNKKRPSLVISVICLALLFIYMEIINTEVPMLFFIPSILLSLLIMFIFVLVETKISLLNATYLTLRAFIVGEFIASFAYQLYYYAILDLDLSLNYLATYLIVFCFYLIVLFFLYLFEDKLSGNYSDVDVTKREIMSVSIIVLVVFMMSNISYVYQNTPFSGSMTRDIFNIRTLVDFGGVALLFAYHIQLNEINMRFEVEKLKNLLQLQHRSYEMSEQSIEIVNQKYHDLKHQIAFLKQDAMTQESFNYLLKMEDDIKIYEAQNKTGNKVLDTILVSKQSRCQDADISMTVVADGKALKGIEPIDISTLFGNLLDNAIESVLKLKDIDKRLIHLTVQQDKKFLKIRLENYYTGELAFKNGLPTTTKKDKEFHGYGLKSIQQIVKKYNGTMAIKTDENWFDLRILISI